MSTTYAQLGKSAKISYERILDDVCVLYQTENKLLRDLAIDIMRVLEYDKELKVALERHVEENPFQQEETINVYAKVFQVRHGCLVDAGISASGHRLAMCTICKRKMREGVEIGIVSRYCPNCGVKLDGGEDDDKTD